MSHLGVDWEACVDSFELGDGRLGLHLGGASVWRKGSHGADVFLALRSGEGGGPGNLETIRIYPESQGRAGPMMGCRPAKATRFFVHDIDGDGHRDLGREVREIDCREEGERFVPVYEVRKIRWELQGAGASRRNAEYEGRVGIGMLELPPLGMKILPVDVVLDAWTRSPAEDLPGER